MPLGAMDWEIEMTRDYESEYLATFIEVVNL
jgi:hypothetical protein